MALPAKTKTWTIRHPSLPLSSSVIECNKRWVWEWKNSLVALGAQVTGSCDGASAGMDGVDRWGTESTTGYTKLVNNADGSAHSWVVLRFPNIAPKFEICLDLNHGHPNAIYASTVISPSAGFGTANGGTNGSITARPTATDGYTVFNQIADINGGNTTASSAFRGYFWGSTDGKFFYWARMQDAYNTVFGFVGVPYNIAPEWTTGTQFVFGSTWNYDGNQNAANRAHWHNVNRVYSKINGIWTSSYLTGEGFLSGTLLSTHQSYPSDLTAGYPMCPVGLYSVTPGARGRVGDMVDLWWGAELAIQMGDCYPADDSRQFIQLSHLILPWDGSIPVIAN